MPVYKPTGELSQGILLPKDTINEKIRRKTAQTHKNWKKVLDCNQFRNFEKSFDNLVMTNEKN